MKRKLQKEKWALIDYILENQKDMDENSQKIISPKSGCVLGSMNIDTLRRWKWFVEKSLERKKELGEKKIVYRESIMEKLGKNKVKRMESL